MTERPLSDPAPSAPLFSFPVRTGRRRPHDQLRGGDEHETRSALAIIGRYILTPDLFDALASTREDRTGEIQLTNGLRALLTQRPLYACEVKGVRHDMGNKLGFIQAAVYFAMKRPKLADPFREYLKQMKLCD